MIPIFSTLSYWKMQFLSYNFILFLISTSILQLQQTEAYHIFDQYLDDQALNIANLGPFVISWDSNNPYLHIVHSDEPNKYIFKTIPSSPFVTIGYATDTKPPIVDGNFKVNEWTIFETPYQNIKSVIHTNNTFIIKGDVWGLVTKASYEFTLQYTPDTYKNQLLFQLNASSIQGTFNRLFLNHWCDPTENFYGFGVQYTHWNLKGRRIPILVAEQGIGRGPTTTTMFLNIVGDGTGGDTLTTYAPKPLYLTNFNRSMMFDNSQVRVYYISYLLCILVLHDIFYNLMCICVYICVYS